MKLGDLFETVEDYTYETIIENGEWVGRYIHNNVTFDLCKAIVKYSRFKGNYLESPELLKEKQ